MADHKKYEKISMQSKTSNDVSSAFLSTLSATVTATVALVSIHHYYRKQQQPEARLQDYVVGINAKLNSSAPLPRLQHAYQQAKLAYQNYPEDSVHDAVVNAAVIQGKVSGVAERHTTTMLPRAVCWVSGVAAIPKRLISNDGNDNYNENDFGVVGIDADRQIVWQTTMPERVHDIVVQPLFSSREKTEARDVVVMGRRPSERFWVLDTATGQVKYAIKAATDRHFYGHACYSLDGTKLYITENDTVSLDGKIGIYDAINNYQKIAEFDSHGIGPHELIMHPDSETLIVANGGIKTEQASREELNLDSMRPSLVYLKRHTGELLEQITPEHNQMSIRHLAMHDDGTVMMGIQFQGEKHINVPLVLTHQRGDIEFTPLTMPNNQWQRFHQYIASVAVDSERDLLCVTTPIGGCAAIYDLNTYELIDSIALLDCAGASVSVGEQGGFIVSDGQGQLTTLSVDKQNRMITSDQRHHKMSFDNHLQAL
ncbi:DUF1513 domain-containing protein [Psychrobacter sp. 1Y11]|uniref:DUF1513 domain-containing protein n=1 Tax=Psychrobacter sp. 1Y11 TaxID=3457446 RepID=UPI003FD35A3F